MSQQGKVGARSGNKVKQKNKTRGGKALRKFYNKFGIYYANIKGIKSKNESLEEIIDTLDPLLICLTETHLDEDEQLIMNGYRIFLNNRNNVGGGSLF